jgi:hypothetical protein
LLGEVKYELKDYDGSASAFKLALSVSALKVILLVFLFVVALNLLNSKLLFFSNQLFGTKVFVVVVVI